MLDNIQEMLQCVARHKSRFCLKKLHPTTKYHISCSSMVLTSQCVFLLSGRSLPGKCHVLVLTSERKYLRSWSDVRSKFNFIAVVVAASQATDSEHNVSFISEESTRTEGEELSHLPAPLLSPTGTRKKRRSRSQPHVKPGVAGTVSDNHS